MIKIKAPATPTGKYLQRETANVHRGCALCIELHPGFLAIWPKGTRERYTIGYEAIFSRAALLAGRIPEGGLRRRRLLR